VKSVEDLLLGVTGVDVRRRGPGGVQADVGIRGATFEQTLILIDGVKVSDPQTGHHNLDLPVALADIERIEVQKGPSARIWGPNAFGGVVNIITRRAAGLESKYVLDHLRHQAVLEAEHALGFGISQNWRLLWEERLGGDAHFAADTRIRRPFARGEVFLEATNLFNARYTEVGGVPQPGRWLNAGLKINFGPW